MTAWIDGRLVPLADASVSVLDHGLVVGDGVFETLRVYGGVPFAWTRHLARLRASADGLGLELPDVAELRAAADAVLRPTTSTEARLRITVTGGVAPPGSGRGDAPPTAFMLAFPIEPAAPSVDVVIAPWTRNENGALAGLKTISYAANVRALAYAHERERGRGDLREHAGQPVRGDGIERLPRARRRADHAARERGLPPRRDARARARARAASRASRPRSATSRSARSRGSDEAFLSSTTREVQPIAHVDGVALPIGRRTGEPTASRPRSAISSTRDLDP